jgi:hypothetical protein
MKRISLALAPLLLLCACGTPTLRDSIGVANDIGRNMPSGNGSTWEDDADDVPPACSRRSTLPVKSRQMYDDYYGTMLTLDTSSLRTPRKSYRWGITNPTPLSMAYFAAYVKPGGKYGRFRTNIFIDGGIKANMVFTFRADIYNGVVLKSLTIRPGQTKMVDVDISGVKKLFIGTELRINHDTARRIVIGEPEFYTCR